MYHETFLHVFRRELVPILTVFDDIKVVDYLKLSTLPLYQFALRRFNSSCLARELREDNLHGSDYQKLYMTVALTDDNHCLRLSRISADWVS